MEPEQPLFIDIDVPQGVLLPSGHSPQTRGMRHPNDCNAVWYRAHSPAVTAPGGAVERWQPENGLGTDAVPAEPNDGNGTLSAQGGMAFTKGVNCGYVAPAALVETRHFCCAVRLASPDGEARTLLTINPDTETYLFLAEKAGQLIWQDQSDSIAVTLPAPGSEYWVAVGYSDGKLGLATALAGETFGEVVQSADPDATLQDAMAGVNDLFIGCRSHRKGIVKTLGESRIFDILLWIDQNPLHDDPDLVTDACRFAESGADAP